MACEAGRLSKEGYSRMNGSRGKLRWRWSEAKENEVFSIAESFAGAAFQGLKQCPGAEAVKDWYPNQQHRASRNLLGKQGTYPRLN